MVLRGSGAAVERRRDGGAGEKDTHPAGDGRADLPEVRLPRNSREEGGDDPSARRLLCRRNHGAAADRGDGGGVLRAPRAAQSERTVLAGGQLAGGGLDPELPDPG